MIKSNNVILKRLSRLSQLYWLLLFIPALYFSSVRTFSFDAAYQFFSLINNLELAIQGERFGAVLYQMPVLVLAKLNAPLELMALIYSSLSVLLPFAIVLFLYRQKLYTESLIITVVSLIFYCHSFFWAHSELFQGLCWLCLFIGTLQMNSHAGKYPLTILSFSFSIFLHPLIPFLILFSIIYLSLIQKIRIKTALYLCLITLIVVGIKLFVLPVMNYDKNIYGNFLEIFHRAWDWISFHSSKAFRKKWMFEYVLYLPVIISLIWFYLTRKKYVHILFVFGSLFSLLFLTNSLFRWLAPAFQMENYYLVGGFILALPIVYELLPSYFLKRFRPNMLLYGLGICLCFRIISICVTGQSYQDRHETIMDLIPSSDTFDKYYLTNETPQQSVYLMDWSIPFETSLLSSISKGKSKTLLVSQIRQDSVPNPFFLHSDFDKWRLDELNKSYFNFEPDKAYQMILKD